MIKPQIIFDLLFKYEQQTNLINKKIFYKSLEKAVTDEGVVTFIIFSCLSTERDKEKIIEDFFKTLFFNGGLKEKSRNFKRALKIVEEIENLDVPVNVVPILVDTEPRRTWGWQVPQDELTLSCEIMVEQAINSKLLPKNWQPKLWSELELSYTDHWTFDKALESAREGQLLYIRQQKKHLANFSDRYHFPLGLKETATRQVGAYAFEGAVLEKIFPNAILLQSEYPWAEKDILYQYLRDRKNPLSIIHPFPN